MKRAQAALEFLITYAWAFLVILIMIIALAYFGIFDIRDMFIPSKCIIVPGLTCPDFKVGSNAVQIVLTNNLGEEITITDIDVKDCQGNPSSLSIKNNQKVTFTVGLCTISERKYDTYVNITYLGESGIEHTVKGEMTGRNDFEEISYDYLEAGGGSGEGSFAGLVAAFDFNENDGVTLNDISGNGNDGTIYGNTVLLMNFDDGTANDISVYDNDGSLNGGVGCSVGGINGKGCSFDGVDAYVSLGYRTSYDSYTWEAWFKVNEIPSDEAPVIISLGGGYGAGFAEDQLAITPSGGQKIRYSNYAGGGGSTVLGETPIQTGQWYHVAAIRDTGTSKLYVYLNGVLDNSISFSNYDATGGVYLIGADAYAGSLYPQRHFNGIIDEVAIYSKALTSEEIQKHYNAQKAKFTDWEDGKFGSALSFDGVNDYVLVANNPSLDVYQKFTVEGWFYVIAGNVATISTYGGNYKGFVLVPNGGGSQFLIGEGPNSNKYLSFSSPVNKWTHVAGTYDGSIMRAYVDGVQVAIVGDVTAASWAGQGLVIGKANWYNNFFKGTIDSVAIYDMALTPEEIALHANS